jgi:predicted P-loop ATPase
VATATRYTDKASNHLCPILQGGQGVGKTTFTAMLTPPHLSDYTAPVDIRPQNKDGKIAISEMFMIILDEIETFDRNEQEHLKSLISCTKIDERRPYARTKETMPRTASFIASINKVEFLSDMTGTRRFPVFQVIDKIDTYTPIDYELLYGTCLWYLQNNFEYWLNSEEIDEVNNNNQRFNALNIEEELLNQYLMPTQKDKAHAEFKTTTDIMKYLNLKMPMAKINMRTLGMALRRLGYEQVAERRDKSICRGFYVEVIAEMTSF